MVDELKGHLVTGAQRLAAGALGVGVSLATKDPMLAMAATAAAMTGTDYMKAKAAAADNPIAKAEYTALFELYEKLDARVGALEEKDRQDILSKEVVYSRFAQDVSSAATPEKREALVNATAHQFDPRKGSPATRDYWLRQLRDLPESELSFLLMVAERRVVFLNSKMFETPDATDFMEEALVPFMSTEDGTAFNIISQSMVRRGHEGFVRNGNAVRMEWSKGQGVAQVSTWVLTDAGETLLAFCKDD